MKNKILLVLPVLCLLLSSCFDLEETYDLKEDGAYELTYTVGLGRMSIAALAKLDSNEAASPNLAKRDTIIKLSDKFGNLSADLSPQEKNLLAHTTMRTQMDLQNQLFKISFINSGKSIEELTYFLANFGQTSSKRKSAELIILPPLSKAKPKIPASPDDADSPFSNDKFNFIITPNSFERKIKLDLIAAQREKNAKAATIFKKMNIKMMSKVTINLPRAAKSIENAKAVLSADKRRFTLQIDLLEAIDHPEMLNFKVNY